MLAFAKDITKNNHIHPEEAENEKLKKYMQYQRQINHEKLIYHSLDQAKSNLYKVINDARGEADPVRTYIQKFFPVSSEYADGDTLILMLRKLINAHNTTNNWYRINHFYYGLVYDCLAQYVKIYNRLIKESPEKAEELGITKDIEIDFDDWVRLYFHDLDFLIGKPMNYTHFTFRKRNQAIEQFLSNQAKEEKSKEEAIEIAGKEFNIEPEAQKIILGKSVSQNDLELFFTSAENPIYQFLYDLNSEEGFMDGESLIDHSYFLAHQLKGLDETEAESVVNEIEKLSKH